jgi:predicted SAM-dependent methyltransferase
VPPCLVNIGCGATWHPAWTNLDVRPVSPEVRAWDISHGLPFKSEQVDACYASHVLEHLT